MLLTTPYYGKAEKVVRELRFSLSTTTRRQPQLAGNHLSVRFPFLISRSSSPTKRHAYAYSNTNCHRQFNQPSRLLLPLVKSAPLPPRHTIPTTRNLPHIHRKPFIIGESSIIIKIRVLRY
ncbi:hypothetical protein RND81_09G003100 [Saponaria officinalis]|uniref:Uncharacterized protein n=1 Tax=Saponaria officinalis TaxID=3572 RepID=A0AAW1IGE2_SAPOF